MSDKFYKRLVGDRVKSKMRTMRVTFLAGPRQCGKTTLLGIMEKKDRNKSWVRLTLDDHASLHDAQRDPLGFIRTWKYGLGGKGVDRAKGLPPNEVVIAIDEAQLAPELFRAIKIDVQEHQEPGRYLLTGSANPNFLSKVSESLAGRMGIVSMYPLSECELLGRKPTFLPKVLSGEVPQGSQENMRDYLLGRLIKGGYPASQRNITQRDRFDWQRDYIDQIILRDIKDMEDIIRLHEMSQLLTHTVAQTGGLVNHTSKAGTAMLSPKTVMKYLFLFEAWGLLRHLPAWSNNVAAGIRKQMKLHYLDSGLVCARLFYDRQSLDKDKDMYEKLIESFVFSELLKQSSFLEGYPDLRFSHYRDKDGREIDIIFETPRGECYAMEVKSGVNYRRKDISNMKKFKQLAGEKFRMGLILHDGAQVRQLDEDIYTVPLSALWE